MTEDAYRIDDTVHPNRFADALAEGEAKIAARVEAERARRDEDDRQWFEAKREMETLLVQVEDAVHPCRLWIETTASSRRHVLDDARSGSTLELRLATAEGARTGHVLCGVQCIRSGGKRPRVWVARTPTGDFGGVADEIDVVLRKSTIAEFVCSERTRRLAARAVADTDAALRTRWATAGALAFVASVGLLALSIAWCSVA